VNAGFGLGERGSPAVAAVWAFLAVAWASAIIGAGLALGDQRTVSMWALIPAAALGPAVFGAASWTELRRWRRARPAVVGVTLPSAPGGPLVVRPRRRRRAEPLRVGVLAWDADGGPGGEVWIALHPRSDRAPVALWPPGDPGATLRLVVDEDSPEGPRRSLAVEVRSGFSAPPRPDRGPAGASAPPAAPRGRRAPG